MNILQYLKPIIPVDSIVKSDKSGTAIELDCRDMIFPLPILKIQETIETLNSGEMMTVLSNDPSFRSNLNAWASKTGNEVVHYTGVETKRAVIRKA
jgi:tRNA 2-thiouridine synthesizing protein A